MLYENKKLRPDKVKGQNYGKQCKVILPCLGQVLIHLFSMTIFKEIKKHTFSFLLFSSNVAAASFQLAYGKVP